MNLEIEIKLSASSDFVLPDLTQIAQDLIFEAQRPKETFTTYFDTSGFELLSCGAALRFRRGERSREQTTGIWALKFAPPSSSHKSSRFEFEVKASGDQVPAQFGPALEIFGATGSLVEIAVLSARRSSTVVKSHVMPVIEIDDDVVEIIEGDNSGQSFREIEIELRDGSFSEVADEIAELLISAGAIFATKSSKLEQAIETNENRQFIAGLLDRYEQPVTSELSTLASLALDSVNQGRVDPLQLADLLCCGLGEASARWFVQMFVAKLRIQSSLFGDLGGSLPAILAEVSTELARELRSWGHGPPSQVDGSNVAERMVAELVISWMGRVREGASTRDEFGSILGDLLDMDWQNADRGGGDVENLFARWSRG